MIEEFHAKALRSKGAKKCLCIPATKTILLDKCSGKRDKFQETRIQGMWLSPCFLCFETWFLVSYPQVNIQEDSAEYV